MNARVHIQHVVLSLQPGGLENGVVNVVNGLSEKRFRSSICCLRHAGKFAARLAPGVVINEMGVSGGNNFWLPWRLARLFRSTGTNIVHTRNAEAYFYGFLGAKLAGVPIIVHSEHGRTFTDNSRRFFVQRLFSHFTDAVFTVSEQLKKDLVRHVGLRESQVEVLYNGVDIRQFRPTQPLNLREQLGIRSDDVVIGSVGRLVPVKNYSLLLNAVKSLAENVVVVFVGDGPERARLTQLAQELGIGARVHFLGHRDDIQDLLAAMDIFVLPSVSEGMSNTLLEAMAAGVTVVASNVGGNPEVIRDEIDGLIFPSADERALRNRIQMLCEDSALRQNLANSSRERVIRAFSIDAMISRYEALYERILDTNV